MLKADKDGFLRGEPIDVRRGSFDQAIAIWQKVQGDVAQIKRAVLGGNRPVMVSEKSMAKVAEKLSTSVRASVPRRRDAMGRFVKAEVKTSTPGRRSNAPLRMAQAPSQTVRTVAMPEQNIAVPNGSRETPERGRNGRFLGNGSGGTPESGSRDYRALGDIAEAIRDSSGAALSGTEEIDPTLQAANEIGGLLGPVLRPFGGLFRSMFGGKDKSIPWYRRIVNELRDINKKTDGSGGFLKFILAALMALPALLGKLIPGFLMRALAGSVIGKGLGAVGKVLGRAGGAVLAGGKTLLGKGKDAAVDGMSRAGSLAGKAAKLGGGILRKLPLIGTLLGAGMLANAAFGADDPSKSAADNRKDRFTGAGAGMGSMIGAALGAVVGGPFGLVVGGLIGDTVGEKVGGWLSTFDWDTVGDSITSAWTGAAEALGKQWDGIGNWFKEMWKPVADVFGGIGKFLSDKFGIVSDAATSAVKTVGTAVDRVKSAAGEAYSGAKATASNAYEATKRALGGRGKFGFEGFKGAEGLSKYGSYTNEEAAKIIALKQSGANTGVADKMPEDIKRKIIAQAKANGLDPEMMLKMAAMESGGNANAISSTGASGIYQFTGATASAMGVDDRFDPNQNIAGGMRLTKQNMAALKKAGIAATPENIYMAHQLGSGGAIEAINGAKAGKKVSDLSPSLQKAMGMNVGKGSASAADYIAQNKAKLEQRYMANVGPIAPAMATMPAAAMPAMASAPTAAKAPAMPSAANVALPKAPAVTVPLASSKGGNNTTVNIRKPITQNIGDRGIAQAATGGIGMRG